MVEWNPAAERMFGYTKKEAGPVVLDLIVPLPVGDGGAGNSPSHPGRGNACPQYQREPNQEITASSSVSGTIRHWSEDPDGKYAGVISLAQDITQRRLAEESLSRVDAACCWRKS